MKRLFSFCVLFCLLLIPVCAIAENPYDLPLDLNHPGCPPDPQGFSENAYHDDSLDVEIEALEFEGIPCFLAHIRVKSPTQLRTALAGMPNQKAVALPSLMSPSLNAVLLLNGEFYTQRSRDIFIYRQGLMLRGDPDRFKDVLVIDDRGDFHIFVGENKAEDIRAFQDGGGVIVNAFSFGPALVRDGERVPYRSDYFFYPTEYTWRSFIGQKGELEYVFVLCEGGTQKDILNFAQTLGLRQAYNLDGGNSAVMLFNHRYVGHKHPNFEREQSDVLYVVSAVGPR